MVSQGLARAYGWALPAALQVPYHLCLQFAVKSGNSIPGPGPRLLPRDAKLPQWDAVLVSQMSNLHHALYQINTRLAATRPK